MTEGPEIVCHLDYVMCHLCQRILLNHDRVIYEALANDTVQLILTSVHFIFLNYSESFKALNFSTKRL